ncbi:thioredoxin-dependent thiol peroxidase [Myxococcus landrumensis]|nr:thioredoxin-dependent thiol peroxidase [Myxococcus landrumus]
MPQAGDAAPDFQLQDQDGNTVTLSQFAGKHVVLYFYPKDDTPGCTTEACGFRDEHSALGAAGAVVLGVSADSTASHRKFATKFSLPFPLLADTEHQVCDAYGVWGEKSLYGRKFLGINRATFLIGPDGRVKQVWPKVKVNGHVAEVLSALGVAGSAALDVSASAQETVVSAEDEAPVAETPVTPPAVVTKFEPVKRKAPAKKAAPVEEPAAPTMAAPVKKAAPAKKAAAKKVAPAKKAAAKKGAPVKKGAAKKGAPAKKGAAKKAAPVKKGAAKKAAPAKKGAAKKAAPVKKGAAKKVAPVKKGAAKKAAPAKKSAAKKKR